MNYSSVVIQPVYFSDIIRCFKEYSQEGNVSMTANGVNFYFANGKQGLHSINFSAASGNLIGIMGGSGAGKSTLLNILNGNLKPQEGEVLINGINIHTERSLLEGVIGYIPQDDLLLEDLTVYQNLFYNSKLALGNLSDAAIDAIWFGATSIRCMPFGSTIGKSPSKRAFTFVSWKIPCSSTLALACAITFVSSSSAVR